MKMQKQLAILLVAFGAFKAEAKKFSVQCRVNMAAGYVYAKIAAPSSAQFEDFNASCTFSNYHAASVSVAAITDCPAGLTYICYDPWAAPKASGLGFGTSEFEARQAARNSCIRNLTRPSSGCHVGDYLGHGYSEWPDASFDAWTCN